MTGIILFGLSITVGLGFALLAILRLGVTNWIILRSIHVVKEIKVSHDIEHPDELIEFVQGMKAIALNIGSDEVVPIMLVMIAMMVGFSKRDPHSQRIIVETILWLIIIRLQDRPDVALRLLFGRRTDISLHIKVTITPDTSPDLVTTRINFEKTALKTYTGTLTSDRLAHS